MKKVPAELRKPSSSRRTSIIDVNFYLTGAGEEDEEERTEPGESDEGKALQSQRSNKEAAASSPLGVKRSLLYLKLRFCVTIVKIFSEPVCDAWKESFHPDVQTEI